MPTSRGSSQPRNQTQVSQWLTMAPILLAQNLLVNQAVLCPEAVWVSSEGLSALQHLNGYLGIDSNWLFWFRLSILTHSKWKLNFALVSWLPEGLVKDSFHWHIRDTRKQAKACKLSWDQLMCYQIYHMVLNKSRYKHLRFQWQRNSHSWWEKLQAFTVKGRAYRK